MSGGFVYNYLPNTTQLTSTWQDPALTTLNTNPIILDAAGRCICWANGPIRQVVEDQFGNLQWDQITGIPGNGNLGIPGWWQFPGGLLFQWQQMSLPTQQTLTFSFPISFPNSCFISLSQIGFNIGTTAANYSVGSQPISNSQFSVTIASPNSGTEGIWFLHVGF